MCWKQQTYESYTVGVFCSQGSQGDAGLPGPQGPKGIGVQGPSVGHKCSDLLVHLMSYPYIVKHCFILTF